MAKKTYHVPICVTISSHITVEATSKQRAITAARKAYPGWDKLDCPCIDVDFCETEDEVEEDGVDE